MKIISKEEKGKICRGSGASDVITIATLIRIKTFRERADSGLVPLHESLEIYPCTLRKSQKKDRGCVSASAPPSE